MTMSSAGCEDSPALLSSLNSDRALALCLVRIIFDLLRHKKNTPPAIMRLMLMTTPAATPGSACSTIPILLCGVLVLGVGDDAIDVCLIKDGELWRDSD